MPMLFDRMRQDQAFAIATEVAAELPPPDDPSVHPCLSRGHAGIALYFSHLASLQNATGATADALASQERAAGHLEAALIGFEGVPLDASFANGMAGVAWVAARTTAIGMVECPEELFEDLDAQILTHLQATEKVAAAEFLFGAAGIGTYALARAQTYPNAPTSLDLLTRVVEVLEGQAIRDAQGTFWDDRGKVPFTKDPQIELGVAHGLSGVVSFLTRAGAAGISSADALAKDTMRWVIPHLRDTGTHSLFPDFVGDEDGSPEVAWCHGDLGIVSCLNTYESRLASPEERESLRRVREHAANRAVPPHIPYPFVCHGGFGNAHLLRRLTGLHSDERLAKAATAWWDTSASSRRSAELPQALYSGLLGTGLVAMNVADERAPRWDAALCLDAGDS